MAKGQARSLWRGSISFGLVNVPIRLYTAVSSHDIGFHQFQAKSGQRIHYKRVAERSGREVPYEDIVKGYEVSKGRIVLIEPEELEALEPKKSRTIEIEEFVDLHEIDPIVWEDAYYVGADETGGAEKSYELLRRAMEEMSKVAIGRFVMRTKEYLATIRPFGRGLVLETMYYADEIRPQDEVVGARHVTVSKREVDLAKQLIQSLTAKWDLKRFKDTYRDRVQDLIDKKARGEEIVFEEAPEQPGGVVDLMEALKASLAEGAHTTNGRHPPKRAAHGRRRKQSRAA